MRHIMGWLLACAGGGLAVLSKTISHATEAGKETHRHPERHVYPVGMLPITMPITPRWRGSALRPCLRLHQRFPRLRLACVRGALRSP